MAILRDDDQYYPALEELYRTSSQEAGGSLAAEAEFADDTTRYEENDDPWAGWTPEERIAFEARVRLPRLLNPGDRKLFIQDDELPF